MTRRIVAAVALALMTFGSSAVAASGAPSENASCVGSLVAFETTLAPGFVGAEQRELAPHSAGAFGAFVSDLAEGHGTLSACFPGE